MDTRQQLRQNFINNTAAQLMCAERTRFNFQYYVNEAKAAIKMATTLADELEESAKPLSPWVN